MWLGRSGWDGDMVWEERGMEMRSGRSEWDRDVVWMTCSDACSRLVRYIRTKIILKTDKEKSC